MQAYMCLLHCAYTTRPPLEAQLRMLCYTVLHITLQTSTKSKLRATHIHHRQVSNIIKDISNTGKRTIQNNTGKHASYVNIQHHVIAWTVTVGSPQSYYSFHALQKLEEMWKTASHLVLVRCVIACVFCISVLTIYGLT